jgi:hypothetical protein
MLTYNNFFTLTLSNMEFLEDINPTNDLDLDLDLDLNLRSSRPRQSHFIMQKIKGPRSSRPRKSRFIMQKTKGPRSSRPRKSRFMQHTKAKAPKTSEEHFIMIMESIDMSLMITSAKPLSIDPMPIGFGHW